MDGELPRSAETLSARTVDKRTAKVYRGSERARAMMRALNWLKKSCVRRSRRSAANLPLPLMRNAAGSGRRSAAMNSSHSPSGTMPCESAHNHVKSPAMELPFNEA